MLLMQLDFYANAFLCHEQSIHMLLTTSVNHKSESFRCGVNHQYGSR